MKLKRKIFNFFAAFVMILGSVPMTFSNTYAEEPAGDAPKSLKTVKTNNDGTYDITLEIEGVSSNKNDATKANVVVVFDSSGSMKDIATYKENTTGRYGVVNSNYVNLYRNNYGCRRIENDTTTGTVYSDSSCRNSYSGTRYVADKTRMDVAKTAVNGLAEKLLSQNDSSTPGFEDVVEMTLIDFATNVKTDTTHTTPTTSLDTFKRWITSIEQGGGTNWEDALTAAKNVSFGTGDTDKVYVIFVSDGNPTYRNSQYGAGYYDSDGCRSDHQTGGNGCSVWGDGQNDPNPYRNFNAAKDVADTIVANTNMELYAVGAFGDATNMQNLGGTYYDATDQDALEEAFADIVDKITMGLSVADLQIEDGITAATSAEIKGTAGHFRYSVPASWGTDYSKASFEGGSVHWNPGHDKTLTNGEKASVTFTVWPSQEAMNCIAAIRNGSGCELSDEELASYGLGKNKDGSFRLITNSEATFKYRTATKIEGSDEVSYSALSQPVEFDEQRDPTNLPETTLSVTKLWKDGMDPGQRDDIKEVSLNLYVDRTDSSAPERVYTFSKTSEQGNEWIGKDENGKSTYTVAPGVMKKLDGTAATEGLRDLGPIVKVGNDEYVVLEPGHDYEFDNESYNLSEGGSNHYHITKRKYHPMIIGEGGKIHDVVFSEDDKTATIEKVELTKLSAENTLNGGILVGKDVINNGKKDTEITDKYEITIKLTGADSGQYRIYTYNDDGTVASRTDKKTYSNGQIKEKIQANQKIMVTDVPTGAKFEVSETKPEGYGEPKIDYLLVKYDGTENEEGVNVVHGNASATATVTNTLESGNLVITKEVTARSGNLAQAKTKSFDLTVNFYKKQGEKTPVRTETLTIKDGETKEIKNIPAGWYYEVVEAAKPGFNNGAETTKTGTIKQGENKAEFKNEYAVAPLSGDDAKIFAVKSFVSGYEQFWLDKDEFTFVMTGNGETKESKVTKMSDKAEFTVNIKDEGVYEYTITEKTTDNEGNSLLRPGVSRLSDDKDVVVRIEVKDNGEGKLELISKTYSKEDKKIYNLYEATSTYGEGETAGALEFTKVLEGRDWESFDSYKIKIEGNGPLPSKTEKTITKDTKNHAIDFGKIKFTNKDVGKTYSYRISESFDEATIKNVTPTKESAAGISFTIEVTDNEDGTLNLKVSDYNRTFTNVYKPDEVTTNESDLTNTLFTVFKTVEDKNKRFGGEEFVFEISGEGFETKTVKITTATDGSKAMDGVYTFTEAGVYSFTVKEIAGNNKEMGYDKTVYTVKIEVVDNPEEGKLEIKSAKINDKTASDDNKLLFTNKFEPEMYNETGELTVKKNWNGGTEWQNDVTIMLTAKVGEKTLWQKPATIKLGNDWSTTFTGLYKYENGKEIVYSVEETGIVGADELMFIVHGEDATEDGAKSVEGQWTSDKEGFAITNTWNEAKNKYIYEGETEFEIAKVDENGRALAGVKFEVNGKEYVTDGDGKTTIKVPVKADEKEDSLKFKVKETETLEGYDMAHGEAIVAATCKVVLAGVDEETLTNTYTKTCEFNESGSEEFVWNGKTMALLVVNNRSLAKSLKIQKTTVGLKAEVLKDLEFTITGPEDFGEEGEMTLRIGEGCEASGYEITCTVDGKVPTGTYLVKESNVKIDGFTLTVSGDEGAEKKVNKDDEVVFKIKNEYVVDEVMYFVDKIWEDAHDKDGKRPEELTINLLANGEIIDTIVMTMNDAYILGDDFEDDYVTGDIWGYVWENLPYMDENAEPISYTVEEALGSEDYEQVWAGGDEYAMTFVNYHEVEDDPCANGGCGGVVVPVEAPNTGSLSRNGGKNGAAVESGWVNYGIGLASFVILGAVVLLSKARKF